MYLRDGDALAVDQRNEFDVFCNGRGSFPKEVFYFSYLAIIPDANATSWILAMRNKGSDYANFNMTFRDASNNVIPAPYSPEHYVAALVSRNQVLINYVDFSIDFYRNKWIRQRTKSSPQRIHTNSYSYRATYRWSKSHLFHYIIHFPTRLQRLPICYE
jgi:hypothetical protein